MAKKNKNQQEQEVQEQPGKDKKGEVELATGVKIPVRMYNIYREEIVPKLRDKFSYKNVMQVPKIEKIVVNMGVGEASQDSKLLDEAVRELEAITGQKASVRAAKKSISNFKLREGMKIGAKVTLRRERMYEFLDRLVNVALPRVRDFRGISDKSFDGRGNYTLGVKEHIIFPEINVEKISKILGMDITFVTSAKSDNEAFELLSAFGVPFRKKEMN